MKIKIRLTANNKSTNVYLNSPSIDGGLWWISSRVEERVYKTLGVTLYGANPKTDHSFLVRNEDGYPINYYRAD
jgi:hypothetical protein